MEYTGLWHSRPGWHMTLVGKCGRLIYIIERNIHTIHQYKWACVGHLHDKAVYCIVAGKSKQM